MSPGYAPSHFLQTTVPLTRILGGSVAEFVEGLLGECFVSCMPYAEDSIMAVVLAVRAKNRESVCHV